MASRSTASLLCSSIRARPTGCSFANTFVSAQCVSPHNGILYACAWNYAPDQAAIARLSTDGKTFTKVFQFHDTKEPLGCPAETPVAKICPGIWQQYADQLGIDLKQGGGSTEMPMEGKGCQAAPGSAGHKPVGLVAAVLGALSAALLRLQRRRRETRTI
jgi:MYXO-CTERM domain-containing protein